MSNCATDLGATITEGLNRSATKIDVFPVNYIFNIQLIIVAIQYFFAELDILLTFIGQHQGYTCK